LVKKEIINDFLIKDEQTGGAAGLTERVDKNYPTSFGSLLDSRC
jgi:hypothetical protein